MYADIFGETMKPCALLICFASIALFGQTKDAGSKPKVQFTTNLGPFTVELEPQAAPVTVDNFLDYAKSGFYNGTTFHRVISTFMVQGGGYVVSGEDSYEEKTTGNPIASEARRASEMGMKNDRGTIAMARLPFPDSATCQFYINVVDNASLNYPEPDGAGYCVFGRVVQGMETIDKIRDVKTKIPSDRPIKPVIITNTKVIDQKGKKQAETKTAPKSAAPKNPSPKKQGP
jgi:peptidyl-prolyl cis-trans isomerase A (cyclophilin A)